MGKSGPEVVYDVKHRYARKSSSMPTSCNIKSPSIGNMSKELATRESSNQLDLKNEEMDIRKIWEDIKLLGSSNMSWKERKKLEDQKVVKLGGKPPKKQKLALSVAQPRMKRQKQREQKKLEEDLILGHFMKRPSEKDIRKRRPEDMVLKTSEGHFKEGVLNVKHLLKPRQSRNTNSMAEHKWSKGKKKGKRKGKGKGKKKGNKQRH